jgi:hypothetical protein
MLSMAASNHSTKYRKIDVYETDFIVQFRNETRASEESDEAGEMFEIN